MRCRLIALSLFVCVAAGAAEPTTNETLKELKRLDQAARSSGSEAIDWAKVTTDDAERRKRVTELLRAGQVKTSDDFFNAALIFQHGDSTDDIRLAYSLANISSVLNPENKTAKWLSAAAWDRTMMRLNKPQWYGTQFTKSKESGNWALYTIDESAVSDDERISMGVPTLAESRARAINMK